MGHSFITYEIKRIFKSRFTQVIILISAIFPILGILISKYIDSNISGVILGINSSTILSETILYPTKTGAILSSIVFTALTVFEFDKMFKYRTNQIIEPISNPIKINLAKVIGLICAGLVSVIISMIIMVPHYIYNIGTLESFSYYILSYIIIIGGTIIFSVMMSAGFYLIFRHNNITYIVMFFAIIFSCIAGFINYQYMWTQTGAGGFSEYFGDGNTVLGMLWNRLFGFLVSLGILLAGLLCNRCHEKGIFKSFFKNCQKYKFMPICFALSLCSSVFVFNNEPIFKNISLGDMITILPNHTDLNINNNIISTSDILVNLNIDKNKKYASGVYTQKLQNITDIPQTLYLEIANGYLIDEIKLNNENINLTSVSPQTLVQAKYKNLFQLTIPENSNTTISICYSGTPKFISLDKNFSKGINKDYIDLNRTSIAPSLFNNQKNKSIKGTVKVNSDLTVITQGEKNYKLGEDNGIATWSFSCDSPTDMSLIAGRYEVFERNVNCTNIEFFYPTSASEELKDRGTDILDIFSYFSQKFGSLNQDAFKTVITSGTHGNTGHADGNISYVSEDCLTKRINSDSQASQSDNFALLTHEIAHEWWGIGINVSNENSNNELDNKHDEWTAEAFAEFSTYLFLKDKFSEDYANELLLTKWQDGTKELKQNFYYRNSEYVNRLSSISKYNVVLFIKAYKMYALGPLEIYNTYKHIGEDTYFEAMKTIYIDYYKKDNRKLSFSDFLRITNVPEEVVIGE